MSRKNAHAHVHNAVQEEGVVKTKTFHASVTQRRAMRSIRDNVCTLLCGPAGTGKTLLASYVGYQMLMDRDSEIQRILLTRLALDTQRLGALPGELEEKLDFVKQPLIDNLTPYVGAGKLKYHFEQNDIEILSYDHARGRSLHNTFLIVEECQNFNRSQLVTLLTRIADNTVVVLTGDPEQCDVHGTNGVKEAKSLMYGSDYANVITFDESEVRRHPFVKDVIANDRLHRSRLIFPR